MQYAFYNVIICLFVIVHRYNAEYIEKYSVCFFYLNEYCSPKKKQKNKREPKKRNGKEKNKKQ